MPAVERDTGLGTTYERIAVADLVERLAKRYDIGTVLEGPIDGITGIRGLNSIPLAQAGASVELVLGDPDEVALAQDVWDSLGLGRHVTIRHSADGTLGVPERAFDLVWNFNALPQVGRPERLIAEMCRASASLVLVFASNTLNYGFGVHRLHHVASGEPWSHGDIRMMHPRRITRLLEAEGFRIAERLLVDIPWWPDIDSPIEEVAATFLPFLRRRLSGGTKRLDRYTWRPDDLPYFEPERRARLERELERHFLIERGPFPLKALFAHHRGVLAVREESAQIGANEEEEHR